MYTAFPCSNYYGSSAPPWPRQPATSLPPPHRLAAGVIGDNQDGSHVHCEPFNGIGAQLCPCNIATATPQTFTMASRPAQRHQPRSSFHHVVEVRVALQPRSARFELVPVLRGFQPLVPHVRLPSCLPDPDHLAVLACPVVVRAAPTLPAVPRLGLPSASRARCDGPQAVSFHHRTVQQRLVAHLRSQAPPSPHRDAWPQSAKPTSSRKDQPKRCNTTYNDIS